MDRPRGLTPGPVCGGFLGRAIPVIVAAILVACGAPEPSGVASPDPRNPAAIVDGQEYRPEIDPAQFVTVIDNPYLPLIPGTMLIYEGGGERVEVTVTEDTKQIMGVTATVVRDQVFRDGNLVEDTFDWFAQDAAGNVWYFGEETQRIQDGQPMGSAGSWEAGVNGAQPGIVMLAEPRAGDAYRQEYLPGEAEDMGRVRALGDSVEVPYGSYSDVLVTEDFTPLEPGMVELKYYAPGIGFVMEQTIAGGGGSIELVEIRRAD